jgi:hypothetical protein
LDVDKSGFSGATPRLYFAAKIKLTKARGAYGNADIGSMVNAYKDVGVPIVTPT